MAKFEKFKDELPFYVGVLLSGITIIVFSPFIIFGWIKSKLETKSGGKNAKKH